MWRHFGNYTKLHQKFPMKASLKSRFKLSFLNSLWLRSWPIILTLMTSPGSASPSLINFIPYLVMQNKLQIWQKKTTSCQTQEEHRLQIIFNKKSPPISMTKAHQGRSHQNRKVLRCFSWKMLEFKKSEIDANRRKDIQPKVKYKNKKICPADRDGALYI